MANSVEFYLARGFDQKAAEYFAGGRKQIAAVSPNPDFSLTIRFQCGESRRYDMRPQLKKGGVLAPLADYDLFRRVYLDDSHCIAWDIDPNVDSSIVWANKIDLCPDTCYLDSTPIT